MSTCKGKSKSECKLSDDCTWVQPKNRKHYCRRRPSPRRQSKTDRKHSSSLDKKQIPVDIVNMIMSYTQHRDLHPRVEKYLEKNPEYYYHLGANSNPLVGSFLLERKIPNEKLLAFGGGINDDRISRQIVSMGKQFDDIKFNVIASNKNDVIVRYILKTIIKDKRRIPFELSRNPHHLVVKYFLDNPRHIQGSLFSMNTNPLAVKFLVKNHGLIDWQLFSMNTNPLAVKFLVNKHPDKIDWKSFSTNTNILAVKYMIKHSDKIKWRQFSTNTNSLAVKYIIRERPEKIRWVDFIMKNSNDLAVDYMLKHPNKLKPDYLVFNENKRVVTYLFENYTDDDIYWEQLLKNPCIFIKSKELNKILLDL